jgi:nitrite reductase/ring-hydroxylating ferredoxin subunit
MEAAIQFIKVALASEIAEGGLKGVELDGNDLLLARVEGKLYCIEGLCTHGLAYLADGDLDGFRIVCPLHSGSFDVRTGAPVDYPCTEAVKAYPVRADGDDVLVGIS